MGGGWEFEVEKLSHIGILHLFRLGWEEVGPHLVLSLTAPDYDRSQWLDVKFKLDLDFPNLPYLVDGKNKITQSNAILCYIARKHNMCGKTEEEKIRVNIMENQIMDFRM